MTRRSEIDVQVAGGRMKDRRKRRQFRCIRKALSLCSLGRLCVGFITGTSCFVLVMTVFVSVLTLLSSYFPFFKITVCPALIGFTCSQ